MNFPLPMLVQLSALVRQRFYTAKLEGATDQAAFEELVRLVLEAYEDVLHGR